MALTKDKKQRMVQEVSELLSGSKMTVVAKYQGTSVKALQTLRRDAKQNGTRVKVVKNRLLIQALKGSDTFKQTDTSALEGMLLYAFNGDDEVAAAQVLNGFAKKNQTLEFVGAIDAEGVFISSADVQALANLPGKNQLLAGLINTLQAPVRNVQSALSGNLSGLLQGLEAKASAANN
jgi:large subunit ribosomal protein L10